MKYFLPLLLLSLAIPAFGQDNTKKDEVAQTDVPRDTTWKTSGFFGLTFNKTELSNWQGGGQANAALTGIFNLEAIRQKNASGMWTNKFDAQYGIVRQGYAQGYRKNADQLFALTKFNELASGKWYYAFQGDYRTQFAPGYTYKGDSIVGKANSDINCPGYVQLALGMDYKPTSYFSLLVSPIAAKITFVNRQYLADAGAFGVPAAEYDTTGVITKHGTKARLEIGARMVVKFKKDLTKNLNWDSYLDLFTNYRSHPGNVDVVFNNLVTLKITKLFTASFICQMLYDDDIIIKRDLNKDGLYDQPGEFSGPRLQVLSTFGFGIGYKF